MTRPLIALLLAPLLACGNRGGATSAADSTVVVQAVEQYRQAWLRGDTASALGHVSNDIRIFISGVPDVIGADAARKLFADEMAAYHVELLTLNRQDLIVSGNHAVDIGTYVEIQMPKTGAPIQGEGRYMTLWRKEQDGEWRIVRYMLNELPKK